MTENNTENNVDTIKKQLTEKQNELNEYHDRRLDGILLRAKADFVEFNEKNTKYFASLEKKHSEKKTINRVNTNGKVIDKHEDVLKELHSFYAKLYKKQEYGETSTEFFDDEIPKLSEENRSKCEGILTEYECESALMQMNNGKSPGSDGITIEFYKQFWDCIKKYVVNSLNYSYDKGELSTLQSQSLITLLPKPEKDISFIKNWRPISLLNTDYKIATKAIANRIKQILPTIIDDTQTGFMKDRYIGENVRILEELLDYVENEDKPCLLFFSDFEKAFDSIDHSYLVNVLKHLNFGKSLIHWINVFYTNATSCVLNNGYMTDSFDIERGVRQGCPLSPYLFIIGIELLSYNIAKNKNIKGIKMYDIELKNVLFADDATFITDGTEMSFKTLINTIDNFASVSGLKLNNEKCNVLKAGALKRKSIKYLEHKLFHWTTEKAKALGIIFTTNRKLSLSLNLLPKLEEFKTVLKQWQHRKLTLMGKVTVIKTFALPKLIYTLTVLNSPPEQIIQEINQTILAFIWDNKPAKIKSNILMRNYEDGGLKLTDMQHFVYSLKCTWIKRIYNEMNNSPLKRIYNNILNKHGGKYTFENRLQTDDLHFVCKNNSFINNILKAWDYISTCPNEDMNERTPIWNNSNIRIENKPIFYKGWFQKEIKYLEDIYDFRDNEFYSFSNLKYLYNLQDSELLKYNSLIDSIPLVMKQKIKQDNSPSRKSTLFEKVLQSKNPTRIFSSNRPKTRSIEEIMNSKWEKHVDIMDVNWKNILKLTFETTIDNTLRNFQYKYLNCIIPTNKELYRYKLTNSTLCDFCSMAPDNIKHLFWECPFSQQIWQSLQNYIRTKNIQTNIDFKSISLGIPNLRKHKLALNYIILCTKYFIFKCKCNNETPNFLHLKHYLKRKINIEKTISIRKGKLLTHLQKWNFMQEFGQ